MEWIAVHIDTNHAGLEPLETFLSSQGVDSLVIDDETDFLEFLEQNHQYWDYADDELIQSKKGRSRVTFYLEDNDTGIATLAQIRTALSAFRKQNRNYGTLLMTLDGVKESSWRDNWKQYYKPIEIGERLLIVPAWEAAEDSNRIPVILNPGLTFGTGAHATTQLCLTALERYVHGGERVLDLGCGSGILSIAALRLGAEHVSAWDMEPACQDTVRENAALNQITDSQLTVHIGDILSAPPEKIGSGYDLIVANIVADVILTLSNRVKACLKPDGVFLCSGIIDNRAAEVEQGLRDDGWSIQSRQDSDGWYAFVCRR